MLGVMGIIISLGLLMYLAYRGINVLILAPLMALLAVLLSGAVALLPVFVFQSLTAPIGAHMVGRAAYRTGQLDTDALTVDELAPAIERANPQR